MEITNVGFSGRLPDALPIALGRGPAMRFIPQDFRLKRAEAMSETDIKSKTKMMQRIGLL
jgi:hypothetical protein